LIYKKTTHDPQLSADKHVRGIDREPIRLLSHIVELSTIIYEAEENNNKEKLSNIKFTIFSSYIVTFIILLVFLWFSVRKGVTQPFLRNQEESLRNHQLAMTDALTNIANRHAYNERITIEIEHFHRHKLPFTLLVLDIDRFKSINDNYGHEVGDEVIRGIANTLKMYVR
jgi:GGDEF domain-containing protein